MSYLMGTYVYVINNGEVEHGMIAYRAQDSVLQGDTPNYFVSVERYGLLIRNEAEIYDTAEEAQQYARLAKRIKESL